MTLVVLCTGVKSVFRHLDATFPKVPKLMYLLTFLKVHGEEIWKFCSCRNSLQYQSDHDHFFGSNCCGAHKKIPTFVSLKFKILLLMISNQSHRNRKLDILLCCRLDVVGYKTKQKQSSPTKKKGQIWTSVIWIVLLSIGETIWSPRLNEYSTIVAPKGERKKKLKIENRKRRNVCCVGVNSRIRFKISCRYFIRLKKMLKGKFNFFSKLSKVGCFNGFVLLKVNLQTLTLRLQMFVKRFSLSLIISIMKFFFFKSSIEFITSDNISSDCNEVKIRFLIDKVAVWGIVGLSTVISPLLITVLYKVLLEPNDNEMEIGLSS